MRRFIARVGNPLEWSQVDKALLACITTLGILIDYALISARIVGDPEIAPYTDRQVLQLLARWMWAVAAGWAGLILLGVWLRRREPEHRIFASVCLLYLSVTDGLLCYLLGPWTSPFAFTLVLGAGVVGFLLFERAQMFWALGVFAVIVLGTTVAEQAQLIPHAPLLDAPPLVDGHVDLAWVLSIGGLSVITAGAALAIADYIIRSWREREERLAEAYVLLREQQDQLVRAESLAAIGSLVTGAAHELRNPLGASSALFQSLREELENAGLTQGERSEAIETLDMAMRGQNRAATIAERLYSLSDSMERTEGARTLGEVLDASAADHPEVQVAAQAAARSLLVNERALYTILQNLIDNSLQAGASKITIDARLDDQSPLVRISIRDDGSGIEKGLQTEIFKPFVTGDKTSQGEHVGLGLYIVHELARQLGGSARLGPCERGAEIIVHVAPQTGGFEQ